MTYVALYLLGGISFAVLVILAGQRSGMWHDLTQMVGVALTTVLLWPVALAVVAYRQLFRRQGR